VITVDPGPADDGGGRRLITWLAVIALTIGGIFGLRLLTQPDPVEVATTGSETETGSESESETETQAQSESESESETQAQTESETETQAQAQTETQPGSVAPAAAPAFLTLAITPWGITQLDRRTLERNVRRHEIPPGNHTLTIENPNLSGTYRASFTARAGVSYEAKINLLEPEPTIALTPR
jgi:cytoskeletal protein RodZ